jgi:hypothetical protein
MPSTIVDRQVEWRTACRLPDIRWGPETSNASMSASDECPDVGQPYELGEVLGASLDNSDSKDPRFCVEMHLEQGGSTR